MQVVCGYSINLKDHHCSELSELTNNVQHMQTVLTDNYEFLVNNHSDEVFQLIKDGYKQGHFTKKLAQVSNIDYLHWDIIGNKSRAWRMLVAHTYQEFSSRFTREQLIKLIKNNGFTEINDELWNKIKEQKLFTNNKELKNIFSFINKNEERKELRVTPVKLDYTTGDVNVKQQLIDNIIHLDIQCHRKEKFHIEYQIPRHINLDEITKVSKPVIHFDKQFNELVLRFNLFLEVPESTDQNILGVDLGKIKPFSAAAINPQGEFSQELISSKKLIQLKNKLEYLWNNLNSNVNKINSIEKLLENNDNSILLHDLELLDQEICFIKRKINLVKENISWLIAKDTVNHAIQENCGTIKVENLSWLGSAGGKWDHSLTQQRMEHKANKNGIKIEKVDCHGTSWEYPESYEQNPAPRAKYQQSTRKLINKDGDKIDKDYAAGVAIACRVGTKRAKKQKKSTRLREIQPVRCRDKFVSTPKRPKNLTKKSFDIVDKVNINDQDFSSHGSSVHVSVAVENDSQATSNSNVTDGSAELVCSSMSCSC